ncbi:MAG: hypothetical protein H8E38_00735 [SAR324 cluster bacterium]|nr:hypothetical protein [SAR324 cluster bacterium]MBL7035958.1 hypothetical protein [SAR324 cluster bacterium]
MLNRTKYFRKLFFSACLILGLAFAAVPASAQFIGINADVAIAYSAAPGSVSGGAIGITHPVPFFPNLGASTVSFEEELKKTSSASASSTLSLITKTRIDTINFFYNIPFPVVSISLGIGAGTMKTNTAVSETSGSSTNSDNSELSTPVSEAFIHIGLPFWSTIEFHLGYHAMSVTKIDLTSKSGITVSDYGLVKKNYTGGMTTIGVQVAF